MLQSVWGKLFVCSAEVVRFSECQLSEVALYSHYTMHGFKYYKWSNMYMYIYLKGSVSIFLSGGARYADMDERPYCKKCFEKVPVELRRRLKKQVE